MTVSSAIIWVVLILATAYGLGYPLAWLDTIVGRFFWSAAIAAHLRLERLLSRAQSRERTRWDDQLNNYDKENDND